MKDIEQFLQSKGIEPDHVIYNMHNTSKPKVDIKQLLKDFKEQLTIHSVVQQSELLFCQCGNKEVINVCDDCLDKMVREGA